jgi:hypothetical protein
MERWVRDIVPTQDVIRNVDLRKILFAIMENKTETRQAQADRFVKDFGQETADRFRKERSREKN